MGTIPHVLSIGLPPSLRRGVARCSNAIRSDAADWCGI